MQRYIFWSVITAYWGSALQRSATWADCTWASEWDRSTIHSSVCHVCLSCYIYISLDMLHSWQAVTHSLCSLFIQSFIHSQALIDLGVSWPCHMFEITDRKHHYLDLHTCDVGARASGPLLAEVFKWSYLIFQGWSHAQESPAYPTSETVEAVSENFLNFLLARSCYLHICQSTHCAKWNEWHCVL